MIDLVHGWKGEKCEVTLEVDESMPNGTQGERYGSDG